MHVESDGALVDEIEECGASSYPSSHSFENVKFDGVQEDMNDFV